MLYFFLNRSMRPAVSSRASSKAKFASVCKTGGRIYIDCCCIYLIQEFLCIRIILCYDAFRMTRTIFIDMSDGIIQ